MNSNQCKTKRMSDSTDRASQAKKKAKRNHGRCEQQWEGLGPYLRMASKTELENLAKTLFKELYKRDGCKVGDDLVSSLMKNHKMNKNHHIADSSWETKDRGVSLVFEDGLDSAFIEGNDTSYWEGAEFQLTTRNDGDVLYYEGYAKDYEGDVKVNLSLKYHPNGDVIKGKVVTELLGVQRHYSPFIADEYCFTAERRCYSDEYYSDSDSD